MPLTSAPAALGLGLAAAFFLMTAVWMASLVKRDAGVVDPLRGIGFAVLAWLYQATSPSRASRPLLVAALVTVWGLRLAIHLLRRNLGQEEDPRYRAMREMDPAGFPIRSLFSVFWLQAGVLWVVALPLFQAIRARRPLELTWVDSLGTVVWAAGLFFETVGDWQLERFRSDPRNFGQVCDRGLWRYTRHPNYFGDSLVWWGLSIVAMATPRSLWILVSPVLMTFLLLRVSGVPRLEKGLEKSRPAYRDYMRRTSAFLPWLPGK